MPAEIHKQILDYQGGDANAALELVEKFKPLIKRYAFFLHREDSFEGRKLTAKKKQLYGEYQKARRDMQEIVTIKANIDTLMGYTGPGRKQEKER